ncbi:MAG: hypothetical protein M3Y56_07110 [Armatimonadota bacterium]|nr:hypothetical protein [Armatimonadota bacterium]
MKKNAGMDGLLDKLKEGMEQVVSGAQDKIQEAQLRAQLRTIEREKADQIAALGSALYAMRRAGDIRIETLDAQFQALDATDLRLDEKQREIDALIAAAAEAFAQQASATTAEPAGEDRQCQCGAVLSPAANFCPACGRPNPSAVV